MKLNWQLFSSINPAGPCQPSGIEAIMDCLADSAAITWQPGIGAMSYVTELTASSGRIASCATNYTHCQLSSLQCGEQYNVTVKALGETCNNTAQMEGYLTTGVFGCALGFQICFNVSLLNTCPFFIAQNIMHL